MVLGRKSAKVQSAKVPPTAVFDGEWTNLLVFVVFRRVAFPAGVRRQILKSIETFVILNLVVGMSIAQIDMAAHAGGFATGVLCGPIRSRPFSTEVIAWRRFENLIVVMAAWIILPFVLATLSDALPDISAKMQWLSSCGQSCGLVLLSNGNLTP